MSVLHGLKPEKVFKYFELLSSVPHGSGNTRAISNICVDFAREKGFTHIRDDLNNVIIFKDASDDRAECAPVILQGHLDMVCAKDADCTIDMEKEPVRLVTDGEWIRAKGTSLGGDNIVAIAIIMAILDDNTLSHPPIEAVFTVDEETGMDGAVGLDMSCLKGKRLINLDSEEEGVFTVGCAGGARVNCALPAERGDVNGLFSLEISISGLRGGHSGVEIDKCRASANRIMGRILYRLAEKLPVRLLSLEGGELDNVIPKSAVMQIAFGEDIATDVISLAKEEAADIRAEFATADPDISFEFKEGSAQGDAVTAEDTRRLAACLFVLPYHVQEMSADIKGLVQTSLNMGVLKLLRDELTFSFAVRSSVTTQKKELIRRVQATVEMAGGRISVHGDYPAWQYARVSPLRDTTLRAYKSLSGCDGEVMAIHAGLECGLFSERIPELDCISFGPDLRDVHSTRERLNVTSTARLYQLVAEILKNLD
ncbi:MAG: aminoacyl-histidine dipeptidase [Clostridia bacterium]|nr:aminoacyl-histidine dipeptidase [Clostridia bacterium]